MGNPKVVSLKEYKEEKQPYIIVNMLPVINVNEVIVIPVAALKNYIAGHIDLDKNILRCLINDFLIMACEAEEGLSE